MTQYETWGEDLETGVAKAVRCGEDGIVLLLRTQPPVSRDVSEEEYARQKRETAYSVKKLAADGMQGLAVAVVEFNKTSEHYKIEIKMYETYEAKDARVLLCNDILTGNAPDMFVAADSIRQVISSI